MKQFIDQIAVDTNGISLIEITDKLKQFVTDKKITMGLLTVFIKHTSASLTISENADPDVKKDMINIFKKLAPDDENYFHSSEGIDDMPAHIKTSLTSVQLSIPVMNRHMTLGTWQGVYLFEHRSHPHKRHIVLHLTGE